jgi:hypothetical protein
MVSFRISADIKHDRRIVLTLPSEVPTRQAELVVTVEQPDTGAVPEQANSADWIEERTGRDGKEDARYSLRGSVVRYDRPTEPVAEGDWEARR